MNEVTDQLSQALCSAASMRGIRPHPSEDVRSILSAVTLNGSAQKIAQTVIRKDVRLTPVGGSGAVGQSGCPVYLAQLNSRNHAVVKVYPPHRATDLIEELSSYEKWRSISGMPRMAQPLGIGKTFAEDSGELCGVLVYELAPGKSINDMLKFAGMISKMLREIVVVSSSKRDKIQASLTRNGVRLSSNRASHAALQPNAHDRYACRLRTGFNHLLNQSMCDLRMAVRSVAACLARMHTAANAPWSDDGERIVGQIRSKLQAWMDEIEESANIRRKYELAGIGQDRILELRKLIEQVVEGSKQSGQAALIHGDASAGNFFWDCVKGGTLIDYGGMHRSMDADGQPIGPAEADVSGFYERLRKYSADFGLTQDEIEGIRKEFWNAYGLYGPPLSEGILRLYSFRTQMSRLWRAVHKFNRSQGVGIGIDKRLQEVKLEWDLLTRIPQLSTPGKRKQRILVVANASGRGWGGIPVFNMELVKGMARSPRCSVTLLMVEPIRTSQNAGQSIDIRDSISQEHGGARITLIPALNGVHSREILLNAAKRQQPEDFGLPGPDRQDSTASLSFDLIIGHSRYSSPAAALIRERWYPKAKLAHVAHTSPLHKADAGWSWYAGDGGSRCDAFIEASRLARIDEQVLPKADLVVGVGPLLVLDAKERESAGQSSRERSRSGGPHFHEIIPGVHVQPAARHKPRRLDDLFNVLFMGRADDPAKGLDDAVRAVAQLKRAGANILLAVRGVDANNIKAMQWHFDSVAGVGNCVQILPFTSDLNTITEDYRIADLVVMPSGHEGFGMIFMEAAGHGVPVLVTQESGAGQFVLDRSRIPEEIGEACVVWDENSYTPELPLGAPLTPAKNQRVATWARRIDDVRHNHAKALRTAEILQEHLAKYSWGHAAEGLLEVAGTEFSYPTIQTGNGAVARDWSLAPEVAAALGRAVRTRTSQGTSDPVRTAELLTTLPEIGGIDQLGRFVSGALSSYVEARLVEEPGKKGFSGALLYQMFDANEKLVAVTKIFLDGLDNNVADELSSLEYLLHHTSGNVNVAKPLAVGSTLLFSETTGEYMSAGMVTYEVASGYSLEELITNVGKARTKSERQAGFAVLRAGVEKTAVTLASLHAYGTNERSSEDYLEWYYEKAVERSQDVVRHQQIYAALGMEIGRLGKRVKELIDLSRAEVHASRNGCPVHGDAHPGNFFYDPQNERVTVIDVTTLSASLDQNGQPCGAPERDLAHFLHILYRNGTEAGMHESEVAECSQSFLRSYRKENTARFGGATLALLGVCSALSFLLHATKNSGGQLSPSNLRQQITILEEMIRLAETEEMMSGMGFQSMSRAVEP